MKNNEEFTSEYGTFSEEQTKEIVDNFIGNFYADFQFSPTKNHKVLGYNDEEQLACVNRFLDFACDDLRPHLLKALSSMIIEKNKENEEKKKSETNKIEKIAEQIALKIGVSKEDALQVLSVYEQIWCENCKNIRW